MLHFKLEVVLLFAELVFRAQNWGYFEDLLLQTANEFKLDDRTG